MKKNVFGFLLILLFILTFYSCSKQEDINKNIGIGVQNGVEIKTPTIDEIFKSISNKFKDNNSFRTCMSHSIDACGFEAINKNVDKQANIDICNELKDDIMKENCKDFLINEFAKKDNDKDKCKEFSDKNKVNNCIGQVVMKIAQEKKDPKICYDIKVENNDNLLLNLQNQCILQTITFKDAKKEDLKYCDNMKDEIFKRMCTDGLKSRLK